MHVKTRQIALGGVLAAFSVLLVLLSVMIESSSLFFIAAASFCVGIAIREWGILIGAAFWCASVLVNFIVSPNKMHCMTFAAMGLYLVLSEWLWEAIAAKEYLQNRTIYLWIGKYAIFNVIYVPILLLFSELIFIKEITDVILVLAVLAGQAVLLIFDRAHHYFQAEIWGKLRRRVL